MKTVARQAFTEPSVSTSRGGVGQVVLATTTLGHHDAPRRTGRPPLPKLSREDRLGFRSIIRRKRLHVPDVAERLGCSRQQLYKVLDGQQGIRGARAALLEALVVTQRHLSPFHIYQDPLIRLSGVHACPDGPAGPRSHVGLDWLTLWAQPKVADHDHVVHDLVEWWGSRGYSVTDRRDRWFLPRKPWGIHACDQQGAFQFHGFFPKRKAKGYYRLMKLEITGAALAAGLAPSLCSTFVVPWLKPDTLRITRPDIAFDLEVPFAAVLPFRDHFPAIKRTKRPRYGERWWAGGPARVSTSYVGLPGAPIRWRVYDKFQEVLDEGRWTLDDIRQGIVPGLVHAKDWAFCTRIEAQINPNSIEQGLGYRLDLFEIMQNIGEELHVIDLRWVPSDDPWRYFMLLAKITSVADVSWRVFGDDPAGRRMFRKRCFEESERWTTPLSGLFEAARTDLQADLDAILATTSTGSRLIP